MTQRSMTIKYNETGCFLAHSDDGEVSVVGVVVTVIPDPMDDGRTFAPVTTVAWTMATAGQIGFIQKEGLEKLDAVLSCEGCEPVSQRVKELAKGWDELQG